MHFAILETAHWFWPDEAACAAWAQQLAATPGVRQAFITLEGPLGAGKTTLVRHLLRALGVAGRVRSPTYTVMEPYTLAPGAPGEPSDAAHFDFYRFDDPREWLDAGLRDVFEQPGLKLAEWPSQAAGVLPTPDLALQIEATDDGARRVAVCAGTALGQRLLSGLSDRSKPAPPPSKAAPGAHG